MMKAAPLLDSSMLEWMPMIEKTSISNSSLEAYLFYARQRHLEWVWTFRMCTILCIIHRHPYSRIISRRLVVPEEKKKITKPPDLSEINYFRQSAWYQKKTSRKPRSSWLRVCSVGRILMIFAKPSLIILNLYRVLNGRRYHLSSFHRISGGKIIQMTPLLISSWGCIGLRVWKGLRWDSYVLPMSTSLLQTRMCHPRI